jgi:adenylate kinase
VRIVLVGPPGAGKGTQAQFIASHLAIPRISTGDIFRYNVTSGTPLGRKAREFMERGDLVPDEVTVAMVRSRLAEDDAQEGFLLDGFPRNVPQAEILKKMLAEFDARINVVLELVVDEDEVVRRLSGRRTCRQCEHVWHILYDPPVRASATTAAAICSSATTTPRRRSGTAWRSTPSRRLRWSRSTPTRAR